MRHPRWLALVAVGALGAGCAHYPVNPPLARFDPERGYRLRNLASGDNSDELFVILTFSGGGTRAAALSYGVLEQLRATPIPVDGRSRRLLDEVDVISATCGGAYTAAYYAVFREAAFATFEARFLKRDIQAALLRRTLAPWHWARLASATFSRSDLAAEFYDSSLYDHQTFGDLLRRGRPYLILNAMDMTTGGAFEFTQDQFDLLYSDLSEVPLARAVAASAAFPFLFSPVTLWNYAERPGFAEQAWVEPALREPDRAPRRFRRAQQVRAYVDAARRPYVHLLDGGLTDNLGGRTVLNALGPADSGWSLLERIQQKKVRKLVVILVNARYDADRPWDHWDAAPGFLDVSTAMFGGLVNNYTTETAALLRERLAELRGVDSYVVEVSFDRIREPAERRYFRNMPTRLALPDAEVDRLREVGARLLVESEEFQRLVRALKGEATPGPAAER